MPFLGVHATRNDRRSRTLWPKRCSGTIPGGIHTLHMLHLEDILDTVLWPGSWHLARSLWRTGTQEIMQSLSKRYYLRVLQRLIPAVELSNLRPARSGVRAQAVRVDGTMIRRHVCPKKSTSAKCTKCEFAKRNRVTCHRGNSGEKNDEPSTARLEVQHLAGSGDDRH